MCQELESSRCKFELWLSSTLKAGAGADCSLSNLFAFGKKPSTGKKRGGQSGHGLQPVHGVGSQCVRTDDTLRGTFALWLGYDQGP